LFKAAVATSFVRVCEQKRLGMVADGKKDLIGGTRRQSRIKGSGGPGQFLLEDPYDVIHDAIVCTSCIFAD